MTRLRENRFTQRPTESRSTKNVLQLALARMEHGAHLHRPKIKLQRFDGHIEKRIWRVGKRDRELADGVQISPQIFLFQQAHYSSRAILRRIHQRHRLTEK